MSRTRNTARLDTAKRKEGVKKVPSDPPASPHLAHQHTKIWKPNLGLSVRRVSASEGKEWGEDMSEVLESTPHPAPPRHCRAGQKSLIAPGGAWQVQAAGGGNVG